MNAAATRSVTDLAWLSFVIASIDADLADLHDDLLPHQATVPAACEGARRVRLCQKLLAYVRDDLDRTVNAAIPDEERAVRA